MKLSKHERLLIARCEKLSGRIATEIERGTDKEFDLHIQGTIDDSKSTFGALLCLWAIAEMVDWTTPTVANMTDYPMMTLHGDWSGVRDTEESKLWAIFDRFVLPQIEG